MPTDFLTLSSSVHVRPESIAMIWQVDHWMVKLTAGPGRESIADYVVQEEQAPAFATWLGKAQSDATIVRILPKLYVRRAAIVAVETDKNNHGEERCLKVFLAGGGMVHVNPTWNSRENRYVVPYDELVAQLIAS